MALSPLHLEVFGKDYVFQNGTLNRQGKGELVLDSNGLRCFSSGRISKPRVFCFPCPTLDLLMRAEISSSDTRRKLCLIRASSENKITKQRLKLLDSYFGKVARDDENLSSKSFISTRDEIDQKSEVKAEEELESLSVYLDKLQKDVNSKGMVSSTLDVVKSKGGSVSSKLRNTETQSRRFQRLDDDKSEDTLNFYTVSVLASINVGVCLFEAAAPVRNNDMGLLSLPLLYGAKINDLIMAGEWWRLITPMFLHSGIPHVALSCWALLTFGPKVCRDYGLFTFCLIYVLGGVSGNFMSFLHTSDPTVGGTGPAFALIGAWLVDQSQNKEMIKRDEYDDLYQKAIIMTGIGLILSHFGPIDDLTNLGALIAGIGYGFFTCPVFQMGRGSERQEGIATVEKKQSPDPCKSFLVFTVFVALIVTTLLLLGDGPLEFPTYDDVVYSLI